MQPHYESNAAPHELDSASEAQDGFAGEEGQFESAQMNPEQAIDTSDDSLVRLFMMDATLPSPSMPDIGDVASKFHAAAEAQTRARADLSARIDRLENGEAAGELRQAVRELHTSLSELAGGMARTVARIDERMDLMAEALSTLGRTMASSNHAFQHLSVSAHEKIEKLGEQLHAATARADAAEKSKFAVSQKCEALERQLAALPDQDAKLGIVTKRVSDLGAQTSFAMRMLSENLEAFYGKLSQKQADVQERLETAEKGISSSLEQSQTLIKLHAKLTDAFSAR